MRKRLITLALAALMLIALVTPAAAANTHNFTDVSQGAWYNDAVQFVFESNIMSGIGGNRFDPQGNFTRGAAVTTLGRIQWERQANASDSRVTPFTDVPVDAWFAPYVAWANHMGVVNGTSPTTFAPNRNVTRQEMVTMLFNFAMIRGDHRETPTGAINGFADAGQVASWARDAMNWAVGYGIMSGRGNNMLAPNGTLTRAEAAQLLMNFLEQECESHSGTPIPPTPQRIDIRDLMGMTLGNFMAQYGNLLGNFDSEQFEWSHHLFPDIGLTLQSAQPGIQASPLDRLIFHAWVSFEEVQSDLFQIGGIGHNATRNDVLAAFGQPTSISDSDWSGRTNVVMYAYLTNPHDPTCSDGLYFTFDTATGRVIEIRTFDSTGI